MKGIENQNQCSICLGIFNDAETTTQLQCGHQFHSQCLRQWIEKTRRDLSNETCPNCRQHIHFKFSLALYQPNDSSHHLPNLEANRQNIYQENPDDREPNDCSIACILFLGIIALVVEGFIIYFYITSVGTLFTNDLPAFSVGMDAKGYIAIGFFARGILSIGVMAEGIFTLSVAGTGILVFIGQFGAGLGFGIYQVGIAWFCKVGQVSLGLWYSQYAQLGVSLISPFYYPQRKHKVLCCQ